MDIDITLSALAMNHLIKQITPRNPNQWKLDAFSKTESEYKQHLLIGMSNRLLV